MSVNDVNSWMNQPGGLTESGGRRDHHTGLKIPGLDSLLVGFGPGTRVTGWDGIPDAYRLGIRTEAYAGETA